MRKTSHDGGDSTSISSGFDNEIRKTSVGIIKTKRNSIKRKVQNFSHESDDTVIEPLLQTDKSETNNRSAKYLLSKNKTDSMNEEESVLYSDKKLDKNSVSELGTCSTGTTSRNSDIIATFHNHMNTNIFRSHDGSKVIDNVKSPVLVEITGNKLALNSNQTPSIFTTAKIHVDSITKSMVPVQVMPVPILSTAEGSILKAEISSEYGQSKCIVQSGDILKSLKPHDRIQPPNTQQCNSSRLALLGDGKSDSDAKQALKQLTSESGSRSKQYSSQIENEDTQQPESSKYITLEKKGKNAQEQCNNLGLKNIKFTETENKSELEGSVGLQQKKSTTKEKEISKKEDQISANISGTSKHLQRQKNSIVEDPKDTNNFPKNIRELDKISTSTYQGPSSKKISTTTGDIEKKQTEPGFVTGSKIPRNSNDVSKCVAKQLFLKSNISADVNQPGITTQTPRKETLPAKTDVMKEKILEITKSVLDDSSFTGSAREITLKPDVSIHPTTTVSFRSQSAKENKVTISSNIIGEISADASLLSVDKDIVSNSNNTNKPMQSTSSFKLVPENKEMVAIGSSVDSKSEIENSSLKYLLSKGATLAAPTHSVAESKLDLAKESKMGIGSNEINKSNIFCLSKKEDRTSSAINLVDLPVTTNCNRSTIVQTITSLASLNVPKTGETPIDNKDIKSVIDSQTHKIVKSSTVEPQTVKSQTLEPRPGKSQNVKLSTVKPQNVMSQTVSPFLVKDVRTKSALSKNITSTSKSDLSTSVSNITESKVEVSNISFDKAISNIGAIPSTNPETSMLSTPSTSKKQT